MARGCLPRALLLLLVAFLVEALRLDEDRNEEMDADSNELNVMVKEETTKDGTTPATGKEGKTKGKLKEGTTTGGPPKEEYYACWSITDPVECCKHVDPRKGTKWGGSPCKPAIQGRRYSSGHICEPMGWVELVNEVPTAASCGEKKPCIPIKTTTTTTTPHCEGEDCVMRFNPWKNRSYILAREALAAAKKRGDEAPALPEKAGSGDYDANASALLEETDDEEDGQQSDEGEEDYDAASEEAEQPYSSMSPPLPSLGVNGPKGPHGNSMMPGVPAADGYYFYGSSYYAAYDYTSGASYGSYSSYGSYNSDYYTPPPPSTPPLHGSYDYDDDGPINLQNIKNQPSRSSGNSGQGKRTMPDLEGMREKIAASCKVYGCTIDRRPEQPCQCNQKCRLNGDCCFDAVEVCDK